MNYSYPSTSSKLSSVGADSYSYDAMGNITDDDALAYTWSAAALLGEVKTSGTSTVLGTYTYSANNQRTKKVSGGNTVHYVYGLGGKLYGEYDNSGALIREYVYLNGAPLAQVDAGSPEVLTYLHTDHLATPRYGTNAGGSRVWTWDSGAFGKQAATGTATVNLRFPGQYFDAETGLHYNWNRYYNPATGRYVSSDPIGLAGGLNTFGYVEQSPANFTDAIGLGICVYQIETGSMVCRSTASTEDFLTRGFSGTFASGNNSEPGCKNNPDCTWRSDVGPIPQGLWKWDSNGTTSLPNGRVLEPVASSIYNGPDPMVYRDLFRTHSCKNPFGPSVVPKFCSEGCITGTVPTIQDLNEFLDEEEAEGEENYLYVH